jgi:hypothetical protein
MNEVEMLLTLPNFTVWILDVGGEGESLGCLAEACNRDLQDRGSKKRGVAELEARPGCWS